jgi:hypothetical protein
MMPGMTTRRCVLGAIPPLLATATAGAGSWPVDLLQGWYDPRRARTGHRIECNGELIPALHAANGSSTQ